MMVKIGFYGVRGGFPTHQEMVSILITSNAEPILLECASTKLFSDRQLLTDLELILISHLHHDHVAMLPHLALAKQVLREKGVNAKMPMICSPEPISGIMNTMGLREGIHYYWVPEVPQDLCSVDIRVQDAQHSIPSRSFRFEYPEVTVVYTGDTGLDNALIDFCRNADIIICEASCDRSEQELCNKWGHMSPRSVARLIDAVTAKLIVLTHFVSIDGDEFVAELETELKDGKINDVIVAHDGMDLYVHSDCKHEQVSIERCSF